MTFLAKVSECEKCGAPKYKNANCDSSPLFDTCTCWWKSQKIAKEKVPVRPGKHRFRWPKKKPQE